MVNYLDKHLMEKMSHFYAVKIFDTDKDPIGPFNNHNNALLESALHNPQATFDNRELYPTLTDKAAILFYTLNKNHPFENGNKRISLCSLLVFLSINDKWIDAGVTEMVNLTLKVAESTARDKDQKLMEITQWINNHMVDA
jgi:death on curing protein